jgi:hypothetical protein
MQKPATPASQPPATPAVHRGRPKGSAKVNRPPEIVFKSKLEAAFKNATNLVKKLKGLQRDRHVRDSESARNQYAAFLAALAKRVQESQPSATTEQETLVDWLSQ